MTDCVEPFCATSGNLLRSQNNLPPETIRLSRSQGARAGRRPRAAGRDTAGRPSRCAGRRARAEDEGPKAARGVGRAQRGAAIAGTRRLLCLHRWLLTEEQAGKPAQQGVRFAAQGELRLDCQMLVPPPPSVVLTRGPTALTTPTRLATTPTHQAPTTPTRLVGHIPPTPTRRLRSTGVGLLMHMPTTPSRLFSNALWRVGSTRASRVLHTAIEKECLSSWSMKLLLHVP
jgi:hypothetical protein